MNSSHCLVALGLFGAVSSLAAAAGESALPERRPAGRYAQMPDDSPFTLATPAAPAPDEPVKGWASNFYISGLVKSYVGDKEEVFVAIKSRGEQISFSLFGNEPGYDGISIGGVVWSDQLGKSKVTLLKGKESATVEFDPQVIQTPIAAPPQPGGPGGMGANARLNKGMARPPGAAPVPVPGAAPGMRPVPRPNTGGGGGVMLPQPMPAGANSAPTNGQPENRQRVRVIKSNP